MGDTDHLETTLRCQAICIPPAALRDDDDDDDSTLVMKPQALAALARHSTPPDAETDVDVDDGDMRVAVIAIWAVAMALSAILYALVR